MSQINIPQKKAGFESILGLVGTGVGSYFGGPAGGAAGGQIGGMVGGMGAPNQAAPVEQSAMTRRMDSMQNDPVYNLKQGQEALAALPPDVQEQYRKPIDEAYKRAMEQSKRNQERAYA